MPSNPLSIAEVLELALDADGGAWVNEGFTCVIRASSPKPNRSNKPMWAVELGDATGSASIKMTMFTAPKFAVGQRVDFLGKGIRFKDTAQYGKEISIGKSTEVHIVGAAVRHEGQPVPRQAASDDRGGYEAPAASAAGSAKDFRNQMGKIGLLFCHARKTALKANDYTGNSMTPDQLQGATAMIFIEASKRNLLDIVPPLDGVPPAGYASEQPKKPAEQVSEDVPF